MRRDLDAGVGRAAAPAIVLSLLSLLLTIARAADAAPRVELDDPNVPVRLTGPWKVASGDSLAWAQPDFDDSEWAETAIPDRSRDRFTDSGFTWYRLSIQVAPPLAPSETDDRADLDLGLRLGKVMSAYEVYAGGILLGGIGSLPPTPRINYDRHGVYAVPAKAIDRQGRLVVALRVWMSPDLPFTLRGPREGPFYIGKVVDLTRREIMSDMPSVFLVGLFALLALYHLELWRRRPQLTSYAWFSVLTICIGSYTLLRTQWKFSLFSNFLWMKEVEHLLLYLMVASGIQVFSDLIGRRIEPYLRISQWLAVIAGLIVALTPGLGLNQLFLPFLELGALTVTGILVWRMIYSAWNAQPEARIILAGMSVFWFSLVNDAGIDRDLLSTPRMMHYGFAVSVLALAASLANKFMRTHDELDELHLSLEKRGQELAEELAARRRLEAEREQLLRDIEGTIVLDTSTRQNRFLVELLRAESPVHLAALRGELREIEALDQPAGFHPQFFAELRHVLDRVSSLAQLPTSDRALVLGQALTQALAMQERMADEDVDGRKATEATLGGMALETVQQVFASALEDLGQLAEIEGELRSKQLTVRREAVVVLDLRNVGRGSANNVKVELSAVGDGLVIVRPFQYLDNLRRAQTARLEFLVEIPNHSLGSSDAQSVERVRLSFRVSWDDPQRTAHSRRFSEVVELCRFEEPAVFRPLKLNPYVIGRPLLPTDRFFGRQEVFGKLRESLVGAEQDNIVVLIGQRRMGKTSILRRLHRHLPEQYVPVLVDLQGVLGTHEVAFFREVAGQVVDELEDHGIEVGEPAASAFESDPGRTFRRQFLQGVQKVLADKRLLIVFDEMEVLEERIRAGELKPQILTYLRSLMQHEVGVSFMLAGTHRLDELTADYWGALFNLAIHLEVGHFTRVDVEALFAEPTSESFQIDSWALEKLYRTSGGHPHFSQLLARELVDFCNRRKLSYVTVQDVNQVVDVVVDKGPLHISYLWDEASRDERLLLLAATELMDREGPATLQSIHGRLEEQSFEPGDLLEATRRLRRKQILNEDAGRLSFSIDLLRIWLCRRHNLASFARSELGGDEKSVSPAI